MIHLVPLKAMKPCHHLKRVQWLPGHRDQVNPQLIWKLITHLVYVRLKLRHFLLKLYCKRIGLLFLRFKLRHLLSMFAFQARYFFAMRFLDVCYFFSALLIKFKYRFRMLSFFLTTALLESRFRFFSPYSPVVRFLFFLLQPFKKALKVACFLPHLLYCRLDNRAVSSFHGNRVSFKKLVKFPDLLGEPIKKSRHKPRSVRPTAAKKPTKRKGKCPANSDLRRQKNALQHKGARATVATCRRRAPKRKSASTGAKPSASPSARSRSIKS